MADFLVATNITKRFGATLALDDVTVSFARGEVHALMGENGAGKSTLGKVIAGLHAQDAGRVVIDGRELNAGDLGDAFDAGVRLVHQELAQCPNLSVAENLCLHDTPSRMGVVDCGAMRSRAARLVHTLDPSIDVDAPLGLLSPGRRQICQIAAALDDGSAGGRSRGKPRVIVFDEPTSSLSVSEADRLIEIVRRLAAEGITILYVSHRMAEVFAVSDRVTVLRDGRYVATTRTKDLDEPSLVEQMIGRKLATPVRGAFAGGEPGAALNTAIHGRERLTVSGLSSPGKLEGINLRVRAGEIVGVGGLVGSGRSELLDAIFGLDPHASGEVRVEGHALDISSPRDAIASRVGYVPEDRRNQGLFFLLGSGENLVVPLMDELAVAGVRHHGHEEGVIREKIREFRVKVATPAHAPGTLSGGNQQKLLIARWLGEGTRVLLLDEPTRGIDVGTKAEVYKLVRQAADRGLAVLLVSSEMPELLALSDRVLVMCAGRITGELRGDDMTQANILRLATVDSRAEKKPGRRDGETT
ncbi:MAG TPA: sugar ABC transporter ATP-binding protein [Phycisphaerales bacterium]|nr:sugar ABC transporter ATP-binding protein [Phycisphaerales bacterium]